MMQLTKDIIAVEVPKGSKAIFVSHWPKSEPELMYLTRKDNPASVKLAYGVKYSLIGVTPLSEEQWREVVKTEVVGIYDEDDNIERYDYLYKNYSNPRDYNKLTATESGLSLLESKGLDINKKYAIVKIEK